jgi:hypothetical protein
VAAPSAPIGTSVSTAVAKAIPHADSDLVARAVVAPTVAAQAAVPSADLAFSAAAAAAGWLLLRLRPSRRRSLSHRHGPRIPRAPPLVA